MSKELFLKKLESAKCSLYNIKHHNMDRLVLTDRMKPWEVLELVNEFMQKAFIRAIVSGIEVYLEEHKLSILDSKTMYIIKEQFDCIIDVLPNGKHTDNKFLNTFIKKLYSKSAAHYHITLDKNDNLWVLKENPELKIIFKEGDWMANN